MAENYYTVEQISQMLKIHPKTIQRYIREGKLRATKIGRSWRVLGHDLSKFTEKASNVSEQSFAVLPAKERTKVSSVIDIAVNGKDDAMRIINSLTAAMNVKPPEYDRASLHAQFLEEDYTVRLTLWGNIPFMSAILNAIEVLLKQYEEKTE